jgi:acyl-CoA thioesterase
MTATPGERIVAGMLTRDNFSRWLGLEVVALGEGACTCRLTVRDDMLNGLGVVHGGIAYSLADSALAFACNSEGHVTVSIENSIRYPAAVRPGDVLTATVEPAGGSRRIGYYTGRVTREDGTVVGLFTGTVYRTEKAHVIDVESA